MRLGGVLNKIFRKRKSSDLVDRNKKPAEDIYKPTEHSVNDDSRFRKISTHINIEQGERQTTVSERMEKKRKFAIIGAGVVVFLVVISLLGVIYVRISNSAFKENKVNIFINGPGDVSVGDELEYEIILENKNRVSLDGVIIGLRLPDNFELKKSPFITDKNLSGARIDVGKMKSKSRKIYKVKMLAGYSNDSKSILKASAKYKPKNVSSFFQTDINKNIHLTRSSINTSLLGVDDVSNGELVSLTIVTKNDGQQKSDKLILKIEYPNGFQFQNSSEKSLNETHSNWLIKELQPGEQKEVKIMGKLIGQVDAVKKFKVTTVRESNNKNIVYEIEKNIRIIPSKIILNQSTKSNSVYPGSFVNYIVTFKNNSTVVLRNLILKVHLPGKFIKNNSIRHDNGYYDGRENVIIWKAVDMDKLKNLQPGEKGEVEFSMQIQDQILPGDDDNKNPYIRVYSEMESLDIDSPVFENKKIISQRTKTLINSLMNINSTIAYLPEDNNGETDKYLQVDKKVFLRVGLDMKNTTNDLKNVKLMANFLSGISWERQIYPEGDNLEFHNRSNQMEWRIGTVKAGTGFVSPSEKAEFVIGVIPSVDQVGHEIELIGDMQIEAKDVFTNNDIKYNFKVTKSTSIDGLNSQVIAP